MLFSQNPVSGVVECYSDDGEFLGNMSTMGDFFIGHEQELPSHDAKDGGPGSGNFGHEGRPGEVGGSGKGGSSGSGSKRLGEEYCKRGGLQMFHDALKEKVPSAFGDEEGIDKKVRSHYNELFRSVKFLHERDPDRFPIVSYEQWKKLGWGDRLSSLVPYEEYKNGVLTDEPADYAAEGSIVDGLTTYECGATERGYGKGKGARLAFDEKFGISKFIDDNPELHYEGGTLYRGIKATKQGIEDFKKAAQSGALISMRGLSSWSIDEKVAKDFCEYSLRGKKTQPKVIFREKGEKERNAIPFPYSSQRLGPQSEVLYSGTARFRVAGVSEEGGITYVDVESV